MKTRRVLLVLLCVLSPLAFCQQKRWFKVPVKHQDKTTKGKYDPDYASRSRDAGFLGAMPPYGRPTTATSSDYTTMPGYRNNRAIDAIRSTETVPGKNGQQAKQFSNLPKSNTKSSEEVVREKGRRHKNVTIGDGICQSVDVRNNVNYFGILKNCRVIEGFLQIVLIENNTEADFQNVSFPELREITGYFLLYRVNGLKNLSSLFPNLEVIRGDILLTDYAFMVYEMQNLQEIGLRKLSQISRGGVRIEKNPSLCYSTTLNWDMIVAAGENFIKDNKNESSCPGCSQCPGGYCWTAQHCQETEKPKCHRQCLGECYGPTESDCYVCKKYRHEGKCVAACPDHLYAYLSRRCITKDECMRMNKLRRSAVFDDDKRWRPFNGSCIIQCPDGYEDENNMTTCRPCKDRCRKIGKGAIIRHISDAQTFRGTTVVDGPLEFQIRNGNPNIMNELTDAFGLVEEITDYIKVIHSFPITSLSFFKKLKVIKGEKLDTNNASLIVLDNPNLSSLFAPDQKIEIQNGRLFFHYNPKLCMSKIEQLGRMIGITNFTDLEVQPESNGEKVGCNFVNINITVKETGADFAKLVWDSYKPPNGQRLLGYILNYIETESENIGYEVNSCGNNTWQIVDVEIPSRSSSTAISKHIDNLKPYTQYAAYVKTFTAREGNSFGSPGGQSEIIFFRTDRDIPSVPINVISNPISHAEIQVKWNPPEKPNGPIGYYLISGFSRPDDAEFLSSRNYCEHGLVQEPETKVEEVGTKSPPIVDPASSCCSKDTNPTISRSNKFDIYCHENITIGSTSPGWRNYCVFNRYNYREEPTLEDSSLGGRKLGKRIDEDFFYNVSGRSNSYLVKNLRHFTRYTISIAACTTKLSDTREMCSSVQYTTSRTKKREDADEIRNVKVYVTNHTIEVIWEPVRDPNSLTVAYTIEYTNQDVKDAKKITDCVPCKSRGEKRLSHYIQNLSFGTYGLRMRSISLAGHGTFTKTLYFTIGTSDVRPVIVATVMTICVLLAILGIAYVFFVTHLRKKKQERLIASVNPDYIETKYVIDSWEVPRENVELLEELGLGNFGMVYRGRLLDSDVEVAIKTISETANEREKNEFLNEASVMKNFSTFHIIKLLGVVSIGNPPFVIMELMENGDLKTYLRAIRDTDLVPSPSRVVRMAAEIADGMAYLESKKFIHRDLAARNCMVSKDLVCKIGDFGMARDIYETDYYKIGKKGLLPIRWMAPENLSDGVFTSDSDVWSFGVVLYEILTLAEIPYPGFSNEQVLHYVLHKGVLNVPRNCPENIQKIMEKCFKWKPIDRPTFMEIVAELEPFLGQDFCEKSFYHSEEGVEIRSLGIKKVYHHAAPIRFHWGNETARWVKEFEDNVTLLDQTKAGTSRGRIFRNGCQQFGNVATFEEVPLDR